MIFFKALTIKLVNLVIPFLLVTLTLSSKSYSQDNLQVLTGPYLGETPPSFVPKRFAANFIGNKHRDRSIFFSNNLQELYFTRRDTKTGKWWLMLFKSVNNQWEQSVVMPRVGRPILAPDGQTMHLGNKYMQRTKTGWSEVKSLGRMFDRKDWGIMRLSTSAKGTYILDDYKNGDVIRISNINNGKRQAPIKLGPQINTGKFNAHPFIAPDESYLIWDGQRDSGFGDTDLYISFKQQNGSWGNAINMGDKINTDAGEAGGYVTPDGKYFFFNRSKGSEHGGIYWVDAQVIENLRYSSTDKENTISRRLLAFPLFIHN